MRALQKPALVVPQWIFKILLNLLHAFSQLTFTKEHRKMAFLSVLQMRKLRQWQSLLEHLLGFIHYFFYSTYKVGAMKCQGWVLTSEMQVKIMHFIFKPGHRKSSTLFHSPFLFLAWAMVSALWKTVEQHNGRSLNPADFYLE